MSNTAEKLPRGYRYAELHPTQTSIEHAKSALEISKENYKNMMNAEPDPVRRDIYMSYYTMVYNAQNFQEVKEICEKAMKSAQDTREVESIIKRKKKKEIMIWVMGIMMALAITLTGFREVHYYKTPSGNTMESAEYQGPSIYLDQFDLTFNYDHKGYAFSRQIGIRFVFLGGLGILFVYLILSKEL
ncbi:MAG: hypothetical protein COW12_06920 [Candidatus Omnitrophica bacterium CG12_big_fil_rev_8_21_14_0_65_45_16]|nr:MAG: hypothetical protein COW12_06920 [Candidatus Omnitrophica bacterium CG12_big_fil_rev_8_21_14_0_65_45_16]